MAATSDDSDNSLSLLTQVHVAPKESSTPLSQDSSCSSDSFIKISIFEEYSDVKEQPTMSHFDSDDSDASQSNEIQISHHKNSGIVTLPKAENQLEDCEIASLSDELEDIKPTIRFIKFTRKQSLSNSYPSSYDDSSMYTEEHQEEGDIIDLDSYNCSQLFDEDMFSQLNPCIEISSDEDMDLDLPEANFNIDLVKVKKEEKDIDDEGKTVKINESQSDDNLFVSALQQDNDGDTMWYEDDNVEDQEEATEGEDEKDDDIMLGQVQEQLETIEGQCLCYFSARNPSLDTGVGERVQGEGDKRDPGEGKRDSMEGEKGMKGRGKM